MVETTITTTPSSGGDKNPIIPPGERLRDLTAIIEGAKESFRISTADLLNQIKIWIAACVLVMAGISCLYIYLFLKIEPPCIWTWQLIYFTAIRVTLLTAVFFVGVYCFKMLSATFQMFQHSKHKLTVLNSLPSLIVASQHQMKEGDSVSVEPTGIYNKILDIIISFSNTGIIGNEHEAKSGSDILNRILGILEKYIVKKAP